MKKIIFKILLFSVLFYSISCASPRLFAQQNKELVSLTKEVMETRNNQEARAPLESLRKLYLKTNKYNEFVEFLNSLRRQKKTIEPAVNFYIGFTRYSQLRYLEETQAWDEYFSQGNSYRSEIDSSLGQVVSALDETDIFSIYAKLILWKFHHDQQDTLAEDALEQLMNSALSCAEKCSSPLPLKQVADELFAGGEKTKARQLYKMYVDKIATSDIKNEELKEIARGFFAEKNLELAEALYDVYLERAIKTLTKNEAIADLLEIGKAFLPKDGLTGDIFYAEKIFKKIENMGGKEVFGEELTYARAFNLEKTKDYAQARDIYLDLSNRFPGSAHYDEAVFKAAMIYTYALRDVENGRKNFTILAKKDTVTPVVIASLYQLGLLAQWQEDFIGAKSYYESLLDKAGKAYPDRSRLTKMRLKEITENKPLEYNLKKFLDVSLKKEDVVFAMSKVDLQSSAFKLDKKQKARISATSSLPASGCMEVALDYLWSGDLGEVNPSLDTSEFEVSYPQPGAKEINLVVVSSSGVVDRGFILLDVH
jgi:TolA-binding protein